MIEMIEEKKALLAKESQKYNHKVFKVGCTKKVHISKC